MVRCVERFLLHGLCLARLLQTSIGQAHGGMLIIKENNSGTAIVWGLRRNCFFFFSKTTALLNLRFKKIQLEVNNF